jgi:hypothetical protein
MNLVEAIEHAKKRRDIYGMDVHVLKEEDGKFFIVLSINLPVFLKSPYQSDKSIYYTAWQL